MKILITDSNGQLGNQIKKISTNHNDIDFIHTDINDLDISDAENVDSYFSDKNKVDVIINCAAYTNVDDAESNIDLCYSVNFTGVRNLIRVCQKYHMGLIQISTDYVFDGNQKTEYFETDKTNPQSVYGKSKNLAEKEILNSSIKAIILRTSWLYHESGNNFVNSIIKASKKLNELKVVNDQSGTPTSCFDLANACISISRKIKNWSNRREIYHYSNNGSCSWFYFAREIIEICNLETNVIPIQTKFLDQKAKRPAYSVLSKEKIKSDFGLSIEDWKSSLKIYLKKINYGTDIF